MSMLFRMASRRRSTDAGSAMGADSSELGDLHHRLAVLHDDPSMMALFYASLVSDEQEGAAT